MVEMKDQMKAVLMVAKRVAKMAVKMDEMRVERWVGYLVEK